MSIETKSCAPRQCHKQNSGRVMPTAGPRCGVVCNKNAGNAAVSPSELKARPALRRSALMCQSELSCGHRGRAVPAPKSRCGIVCNKSAWAATMTLTRPWARHPAPGGARLPVGISRCGAIRNKNACAAAMFQTKPRVRHADRRSAASPPVGAKKSRPKGGSS